MPGNPIPVLTIRRLSGIECYAGGKNAPGITLKNKTWGLYKMKGYNLAGKELT